MRPIVDGLETELAGKMKVIRLDMQDNSGKVLGAKYGFMATPTFVLFDDGGEVIMTRVGSLEPEEVRQFISP